jgi:hypothetical protein
MTTLTEITTKPINKDRKTYGIGKATRSWKVPHIVCKDGTTLSVQAGENAYCEPEDNRGPWTKVEVGRITTGRLTPAGFWEQPKMPRSWAKYENGGVYAFVPVELVRDFIKAHGGEARGVRNTAVER